MSYDTLSTSRAAVTGWGTVGVKEEGDTLLLAPHLWPGITWSCHHHPGTEALPRAV